MHTFPSPLTQNTVITQAHSAITPTATGAIATATVSMGVATAGARSQIQADSQVDVPGTASTVFHPVNSPSMPRNQPSITSIATPTRIAEVMPTPVRSIMASPTPTPEAKIVATPLPIPTSSVPIAPPVISTPVIPSTPAAGQN